MFTLHNIIATDSKLAMSMIKVWDDKFTDQADISLYREMHLLYINEKGKVSDRLDRNPRCVN